MICTSNYSNKFNPKVRVVSISGDKGKDANFEGECYPALAPKKGFWEIWHKNIGKRSPKENNTYYIEEYYKQVLANLDPYEVYNDLDGAILLCYEKEKDFCHRQIVAAWFELLLEMEVPEVKSNGGKIEFCERDKFAKSILYNILKEKYKGSGCNSVRAAYLNEKARQLIVASFDVRDEEQKSKLKQRAVELKQEAIYSELAYNHNLETRFKLF